MPSVGGAMTHKPTRMDRAIAENRPTFTYTPTGCVRRSGRRRGLRTRTGLPGRLGFHIDDMGVTRQLDGTRLHETNVESERQSTATLVAMSSIARVLYMGINPLQSVLAFTVAKLPH